MELITAKEASKIKLKLKKDLLKRKMNDLILDSIENNLKIIEISNYFYKDTLKDMIDLFRIYGYKIEEKECDLDINEKIIKEKVYRIRWK
jgi:hypothetical protein